MVRSIQNLKISRLARLAWLPLCLILVACHVDMYDQPKYKPNAPSDFFADGRANQPPVPNTVSMGSFDAASPLYTGKVNGELAVDLPPELKLTPEFLERGRTRFNAFCSPCHGLLGNGQGVIAYRGPIVVPGFHNDRLRTVGLGYFFDVMTNGLNRMYSYGGRIPVEDRWAVAAYIRALQLSQNADINSLPDEDRTQVEAGQ